MRLVMTRLALALAGLATLPAAQAAVLTFDTGRLVGASGVVVNGSTYDVTFIDGTCAGLFNGCDDAADFLFNTQALGRAASQALLGQVFNASPAVDTDPSLTRGCENSVLVWQGVLQGMCFVLTPWTVPFPDQVGSFFVANEVRDAFDAAPPDSNYVLAPLSDTGAARNSTMNTLTWAVWRAAGSTPPGSAVPEPASALLAALGLGLMAAGRARRRGVQNS